LLSLLEVMERGTPCKQIIYVKNNLAMWWASVVFWQGMKCNILENRSPTTNTASLPLWVLGKPSTRSIEMSSQGALGIVRGIYKPEFCDCPLNFWQTGHLCTNFPASLLSWG
jgi:hypothetical protein